MKALFNGKKSMAKFASPINWITSLINKDANQDQGIVMEFKDDSIDINVQTSSVVCWLEIDVDLFKKYKREETEHLGIFYPDEFATIMASCFEGNTLFKYDEDVGVANIISKETGSELKYSASDIEIIYGLDNDGNLQLPPKTINKDKLEIWSEGTIGNKTISKLNNAMGTLTQDILVIDEASESGKNMTNFTITDSVKTNEYSVNVPSTINKKGHKTEFDKDIIMPMFSKADTIKMELDERIGIFKFDYNDSCEVTMNVSAKR